VTEAIGEADLVVICPSNPWVSIDPILSIPGIREAVAGRMTVAVSPIIGGRALKGPAAKMYAELGIDPSAVSVARHYNGLIGRIVIDNLDVGLAGEIEALGIQPLVTDTVMKTRADRRRLAKKVLESGGMAAQSPGDE
jgi:LPPG:FO 2-phospho-L-lactate transferase